jgi:two-component system chemotaxis sensor kinase CheA
MDVVRNNIDQIGGTIEVKSTPNEGSSFTIKIPLTLAIVPALIVESGGDRFAIPQIAVIELVRAQNNSEHKIERIKEAPVLRLRDKLLPLIRLQGLLQIEGGTAIEPENGFIVVTQVGSQTFGIVVDGVFHTEEIVVKPMSTRLRHISMFSGNTILGDGSVIMIIDPNGIAKSVGTVGQREVEEQEDAERRAGGEEMTSLLIFRAGAAQPKAVPLSLVTRLEELDTKKVEISNGRPLIQYRGQLMPLIRVNDEVKLKTEGTQPLLVFSDEGRSMGLVVDQIVDIVEDRLNIEVPSDIPGVLGSAVIKGQATEILDVGYYLPQAFEDWLIRTEKKMKAKARTILFVEDSAFFRNMLTPVLRSAGYAVTTVPDAHDALAVLKSGDQVDMIVTDIEMPGMSGFELAQAVRSDERIAKLPIIALSALTSPDAIERGRQVGFHDYVAKFDRPGLIAALKEQAALMGDTQQAA